MTAADWGTLGLGAALAVSMLAAVWGMIAAALDSGGAARAARWLVGGILLCLTVSSAALLWAILTDQFIIQYIHGYSEKALPLGYKLSVFWAGQAGSLLLWAWMTALMGVLAVGLARRRSPILQGGMVLTLAAVCGFFALVMCFAAEANPFQTYSLVAEGSDAQMRALFIQTPAPISELARQLHADLGYGVGNVMLVGNVGPADAALLRQKIEQSIGPLKTLGAPPDGAGLKPVLQDPAMIIHPPVLFLGYAGFTVPLALLVGGLMQGTVPFFGQFRKRGLSPSLDEQGGQSPFRRTAAEMGTVPGLDSDWQARARRWAVSAWAFLGLGILLGSWWAYIEQGWGGYWFWDPVENASLLPWLTGIALLHALVVMKYRGLFKPLAAILIVLTFLLCIFGTWLTRGGVLSEHSVHSFANSNVGLFFGYFMLAFIGLTALLMVVRHRALRAETATEWGGREWLFFAACVLTVLMMAVTLIGTMWPIQGKLVSLMAAGLNKVGLKSLVARLGWASADSWPAKEVDKSFYSNYVLLALGLPLAALMAFGPLIAYGKKLPRYLVRMLSFVPVAAAVVVAMWLLLLAPDRAWVAQNVAADQVNEQMRRLWLNALWMGLAVAIAGAGVAMIVLDFVRSLSMRRRVTGESGGWAALRLLDQNRRRYGAQLAHVGMLLAVLAIAASSMFDSKHRFVLERNESKLIGQYVFTYTDWEQTRRPGANYAAEVATVRVAGPGGGVRVLRPELRSYDKWPRERNQEFALHSNLVRDLSVSLVNDWQNGTAVGLEVRIKPLVMWLWIGGVLVMLGGLLALTPPLSAVPQAADTPDSDGDRTEQLRSDAWRATLRRGRDADGPDEAGRGSKRDSSRLETSPSSSTTRDGKARRPDRQPVKT